MLTIGSLVGGKYKILNLIGHGGMSNVYLAMNERANKQWAIKEVRKEGESSFQIVKQSLIAETEMLKNLQHPSLPSIVDVIDENDRFLIVMDYIEGNSLQKALDEYGTLPQDKVIVWAEQLCDVLHYLHTRKPSIIYRDLKPSNIILKPDGRISLIDFGTAREYKESVSEDTTCLGTRGYAAPEQFGGQGQTNERTDIYCLGTTLYHLLTGHNPSKPPYEMYPIRHWNPQLSAGLEEIVQKCTRMNPDERYASAMEVKYDLMHQSELDSGFRKRAGLKLGIFAATFALGIVCLGASWYIRRNESMARAATYEDELLRARGIEDTTDRINAYRNAIALYPNRERAYLELLNHNYLRDGIFSREEDEQLRELLISKAAGGKSHEQMLAENEAEYADFCYRLGMAFFYSYEGVGNKSMSSYWLNKAIQMEGLSESQRVRALRLGAIADYYSELGQINKSGDSVASYRAYWMDLKEIAAGNITEMDNETTALMIYNELLNQICMNAFRFKEEGITREEMEAELKNVAHHLKTDIHINEQKDDPYKVLMKQRLEELLPAAHTAIDNAFHENGRQGS